MISEGEVTFETEVRGHTLEIKAIMTPIGLGMIAGRSKSPEGSEALKDGLTEDEQESLLQLVKTHFEAKSAVKH